MSDTIDINISPVVENVTLTIEPNLTTINVNTINGGGGIESVVAGANISVDNTDPDNPIVSATGLVPYTGATSDVNLGEFGVLAGNLEFDNTPTNIPTSAGGAYWNDSDGTLDLILKGGNVKLQVGQESVIRVVNKTATNINLLESNYQAVRVTGAQGQRLKVDLAQATTDNLSAETIGLVTETINNNQEGFITTSGLVRNINTTGSLQGETWADGDILYLSPTTAGRITKVKPVAPNHLVIIGYVVSAHATQGSIFVKVDNGYELDELHNVKIDTPLDNQGLVYNSTLQVWENKTIDLQRVLTEGDRTIKVISDFAPYTFELLDKSKFLIDNDGEDKTVPANVFPVGAVLKIFAEVSTINILQGVGVNIYAGGTPSNQTLEVGELAILTLGDTNNWRFNKIGYKEIPAPITIDATPTDGSSNAVSSNGVFDALALKQDKVTGVSDTEIGYLDGVTSAIQTQLNNRLRILSKSGVPTSTVTGTLTETEILKITIPANTMTTTDLLNIERIPFYRAGFSSAITFRVKLSTSASMPATTTDQIAQTSITAANQVGSFSRSFWQSGGSLFGASFTQPQLTDFVSIIGTVSSKTFDPTVVNYLYVSVTLGNISDSIYLGGHLITV